MANLTETSTFTSNVYLIEQTDLVIGGNGPGDIANKQAQALANRTTWLKDNLYRYKDVAAVTTNKTLAAADAGILQMLTATGHITATLPDVTTTTKGDRYPFTSLMPYGKCCTITRASTDVIKNNDGDNRTVMYIYGGERIVLVSQGTYWLIESAYGNFDTVGESRGVRKRKGNTLVLDGSIVNRADYPRLWEFVQSLTTGQEVVTDADWLAGTGGNVNAYRGCFSLGNGTTTMRLPDERGLFDRYLDLSRGLDTGRIHEYAGGLEMDEVIQHNHADGSYNKILKVNGAFTGISFDNTPTEPNLVETGTLQAYGGTETRPKNIGKIPIINF